MKTSEYTELTNPSASAYVDVAYAGQNYKMQLKNLLASMALNSRRRGAFRDDRMDISGYHDELGWEVWATGGASPVAQAGEADHPGIEVIQSGLNSGDYVSYYLDYGALEGGFETDAIFKLVTTSNLRIRFGVANYNTTTTTPLNGVYINITNSALVGETRYAGTNSSTTPTSYTLSTGVWYRMRVAVNEEASQADFYLYDETGLELWHESLTTNLPTPDVATNPMSHHFTLWRTINGITNMAYIDFLSLNAYKELMR